MTARANIDRGMVWVVRTLDRVRQRCFGASSEWPVAAGRYYVGRKDRPVAISTLGSLDLMHRIGRREEFAIVGKTFTENIGIEKVVQNIVSNSAIRFLILCGQESPHKVGQSFIALKRAGVDSEGRIVGSQGKIPVLKNLSREQISRFREQVELVDLIGEQRVETIMATVAELNRRNLAAFEGKSTSVALTLRRSPAGTVRASTIIQIRLGSLLFRSMVLQARSSWSTTMHHSSCCVSFTGKRR